MKNAICLATVLLATVFSSAQAETFRLQVYQVNPENRTSPTGDFFQDYIFQTQCTIKIADSALQPNAFIDITSAAFENFQCTVQGNDKSYSFEAGSEVAVPDFIRDIDEDTQFGLRLNSDGRPLRFDSPQFSTSNGFGLFDEPHPEEAFFGQTTGSFLQLDVQSRFDTPFGVLLEPALVGSTPRPRGFITSDPGFVETGKEVALLNGNFDFIEQSFRDGPNPGDFGEEIENPARFDGFVTFDEKLKPKVAVFYVNGIKTDRAKAYREASIVQGLIDQVYSETGRGIAPKVQPPIYNPTNDLRDILLVYEEKLREFDIANLDEDLVRVWNGEDASDVFPELSANPTRAAQVNNEIREEVAELLILGEHGPVIASGKVRIEDIENNFDQVILAGYSEGTLIVPKIFRALRSDVRDKTTVVTFANLSSTATVMLNSIRHIRDRDDHAILRLIQGCLLSESLSGNPEVCDVAPITVANKDFRNYDNVDDHNLGAYYLDANAQSRRDAFDIIDDILPE